jgi:hypothetical protein
MDHAIDHRRLLTQTRRQLTIDQMGFAARADRHGLEPSALFYSNITICRAK